MVFVQDITKAKKLPQYLAAVVVCIAAASIGTLLGWTSPTQTPIVDDEVYGFPVTQDQFSWISSLSTLGAAIMAIPSAYIVGKFGPKVTMLVFILPLTIGYVLLIWAQNVIMMCIARFLLGMVAGTFCVTCPMYIAEISEKEVRGMLGSFFQLLLTVGILFVYIVGSYVSVTWLTAICAMLPLAFGVLLIFMPESPTFLVKKNKTGSAINSLQWLRGNDYNYQPELEEIQAIETEIKENKLTFGQALSRKSTVRGLIISLGLMFFQQCSGVNAVIFYGAEIFKDAQTGINQNLSQIIVGVMQVGATFASSLLIDRAGRRVLLLASGFVMALSATALGVFFYLKEIDSPSVPSLTWLPVVSLCLYIILFSIGFGPVPWLMMGEIFASDVRGIASSFTATMNWICAFIVTKVFVSMKEGLGAYGAFWVFAAVAALSVFFIFFFVPETKGKSLQDIQRHLEGNSGNTDESNEKKTTVMA